MRIHRIVVVSASLLMVIAAAATASAKGYEWRDNAAPYDFLFDNHIDTHQQSLPADGAQLQGFLYITPSGTETDDGTPIVMHGDCSADPEACSVGWILKGLAYDAEYCGHISGEHPAWAIDPDAMPKQRGYTHFHWLNETEHHDGLDVGTTYDGYLLRLTATDTFVFDHHGEFLVTPGIDFDTHANVYAACEDWPGFGQGSGHDH